MSQIKHYIIERSGTGSGKDTLINAIQDRLGYHIILHYQKPLVLSAYEEYTNIDPRMQYQIDSFDYGFSLLDTNIPTIYNRFHLRRVRLFTPLPWI